MLAYTLMNLLKSPGRTFQVFIGTLLVLLLLFAAAAFQSGMDESLTVSGDEQNIILLGAGSEESLERSEVSWNAVSAAKGIRGLEQQFGQPLISPEAHYNTIITVNDKEYEAMLRGVYREALAVYPALSIQEGSFPDSGEVMVGRLAWKRLGIAPEELTPGKEIIYEKKRLKMADVLELVLYSHRHSNQSEQMKVIMHTGINYLYKKFSDNSDFKPVNRVLVHHNLSV